MRRLVAVFETLCVTALIGVGILLTPYVMCRIVWQWLFEPRVWREPRDVGRGYYEHP
jgi:hypothetical protein